MMTCDGDSLWLMLPAGLQQRDLDAKPAAPAGQWPARLQRASSTSMWIAVRRTISGWPAAVACCSGCRKANAYSRCRVRRQRPSMRCMWPAMARSWFVRGRRACRDTAGARGGWNGRRWSVAEQGYPAISALDWWWMRRAWPGRPAHAAWYVSLPMAERVAVTACTTACQARNSAKEHLIAAADATGGRNGSGRGGVRPGAGTAFGTSRATGDRAGGSAPQRTGAGHDHDAPLQIADGDRDLRIVARLLSFADSASNTYRYRLAATTRIGLKSVRRVSACSRVWRRAATGWKCRHARARPCVVAGAEPGVPRAAAVVAQPVRLLVLASVGLLLTSWFARLYRRRLQRRHAYQLALHKQELAEQASAAKTRFLATSAMRSVRR